MKIFTFIKKLGYSHPNESRDYNLYIFMLKGRKIKQEGRDCLPDDLGNLLNVYIFPVAPVFNSETTVYIPCPLVFTPSCIPEIPSRVISFRAEEIPLEFLVVWVCI